MADLPREFHGVSALPCRSNSWGIGILHVSWSLLWPMESNSGLVIGMGWRPHAAANFVRVTKRLC